MAIKTHGQSSVFDVTLNTVNVIVGAGLLGFPYAGKLAGYVPLVAISLVLIYLMQYSLNLMVRCGMNSDVINYEELVFKNFGMSGLIIFFILMIFYEFGTTLTYLIIIGDISVDLFNSFNTDLEPSMDRNWMARRIGIMIVSLVIVLPLSCFDNLARLEKFSVVSVVATLLMMVMCLIFFLRERVFRHHQNSEEFFDVPFTTVSKEESEVITEAFGSNLFKAFGILTFTFVCHDSAFLMLQTLKSPTENRWKAVTRWSQLAAFFCTIGLALIGYFTFGQDTKQDILRNYEVGRDIPVILTRIFYLLSLALTFPISFFVCRHVLSQTMLVAQVSSDQVESVLKQSEEEPMAKRKFIILTGGLFGFNVLCSLFIKEAGDTMSLTGNICAVALAFVFPPLCALKMGYSRKIENDGSDDLEEPLVKDHELDLGWSKVGRKTSDLVAYSLILIFGVVTTISSVL